MFYLVEKKDHLAVHGHFYAYERAKQFLENDIVFYCANGYFVDKTLAPDDFEIIEKEF